MNSSSFWCYFSKSDHIAHYKANDPNSQNKLRTKMNECSIFVWPNNGTAAVFGIFNVHADVDACDCTRWMYGHHKRVCTESSLWKENLLPHLGLKPMSALRLSFQSDALPTEPLTALLDLRL